MHGDRHPLSAHITVGPGEERRLLRSTEANTGRAGMCLALHPTQEESSDDGGSQSPVGVLVAGPSPAGVRIEFDIRDGTVIPLPAGPFEVHVRNLNGSLDPAVTVSAFAVPSGSRPVATRTVDIGFGMEQPNVRVPAFADGVFYDLGLPDHRDYRALVSDSATGETYGLVPPATRHPLSQRARFIRFMNLPAGSAGTAVFFLSI